ncbi:MAG: MBL fold metallo-hydrolase, partial [Bdellovibrionota bacterium]
AEAERNFQFGSVTLDVLYPFETVQGEIENVNNGSVVIRAVQGENEILLMGDAELEVEAELLAAWAAGEFELAADTLKAGHHGSRTSSSLEFLKVVSPELMVISSGEGNDYGHPHEETLEKAEDLGIAVLRTDLEGTVSLIFED